MAPFDAKGSGDRWPWILNGTANPASAGKRAADANDEGLVETLEWLQMLSSAHPSSQELASLAEGERCAPSVRDHVAACATCQALVTPEQVDVSVPSEPVPGTRAPGFAGRQGYWLAAAAAAIVVAGAASVSFLRTAPPPVAGPAHHALEVAAQDPSRIGSMTFELAERVPSEEGRIGSMTFEASERLAEQSNIQFGSRPEQLR